MYDIDGSQSQFTIVLNSGWLVLSFVFIRYEPQYYQDEKALQKSAMCYEMAVCISLYVKHDISVQPIRSCILFFRTNYYCITFLRGIICTVKYQL